MNNNESVWYLVRGELVRVVPSCPRHKCCSMIEGIGTSSAFKTPVPMPNVLIEPAILGETVCDKPKSEQRCGCGMVHLSSKELLELRISVEQEG